jgi:chitinase
LPKFFVPFRLCSRLISTVCLALCAPPAAPLPPEGSAHRSRPLLVGYFGQWSLHNDPPYYLKDLVTNGSAALLDQVNYSQTAVKDGRCSIADPDADLNTTYTRDNSVSGKPDDPAAPFRGYFHQLKELKKRYPHLKILISLEGSSSNFVEDAKPENRRTFVASCVDTFLRGHFGPGIVEPGVFDGIDVDWEYPQETDADNFRALLAEFRRQMDAVRRGLRLSVAVGPHPRMEPGSDFAKIAVLVDQIGVMNYDYTGPWSATTGFLAPLFPHVGGHSGSIVTSMEAYENVGVPREKLLMGLPFYGYGWTGVNSANSGLFQAGKGIHGDKPYRYIRTLAAPCSVYRDRRSRSPWFYAGGTFWTYDDAVSVSYKVSYAARQHLGGIMIWELSEDTADAELLHTAYRSLRHPEDDRAFDELPAGTPVSSVAEAVTPETVLPASPCP